MKPKLNIAIPKCKRCKKVLHEEVVGLVSRLNTLYDENQRLRKSFLKGGDDDGCPPGVIFVASKQRMHFHRQGCKWTENIPDAYLEEFFSHKEAVEAGKKPCKTCKA